jgi:DNA-binding protein H-NS
MADRLASIRKQIAALEKRASELLKAENQKVIDRIKALIDRHQLTAEDLGLAGASNGAAKSVTKSAGEPAAKKTRGPKRAMAGKKKGAVTVGVPMYQDPKSGKTWTGRGKPPNWIAKAKDRSSFLIAGGSAANAEVAAAVAAPAKGRKAKAGKRAAAKPVARKGRVAKAEAVTAAPKPPKAGKKVASKRGAKSPGKAAPPPPAPAAEASAEA